ncbi:hypothetical protein N658DRAFT_19556 [Parathielavia hyrcaniae]|uniref:Uncharacterized protein n=1 Tax=Parathielavia hyrcaniae TaxID=113614 RepID=A0AAN6QA37_9PEZI|nr:hypothetical protein N658DRAFT_19556 [Parathielavia hyrcaniae]
MTLSGWGPVGLERNFWPAPGAPRARVACGPYDAPDWSRQWADGDRVPPPRQTLVHRRDFRDMRFVLHDRCRFNDLESTSLRVRSTRQDMLSVCQFLYTVSGCFQNQRGTGSSDCGHPVNRVGGVDSVDLTKPAALTWAGSTPQNLNCTRPFLEIHKRNPQRIALPHQARMHPDFESPSGK